jgi:hypothetical protein
MAKRVPRPLVARWRRAVGSLFPEPTA